MRGRRRYVVCYDIRDPVRLRRVHKVMKSFGWSMQYSVFVADLDAMELIELRDAIGRVIHHREDSVAWIECGDPAERGVACFSFMGVAPSLPTGGPTVL
jgi:CRISPR-associated protein Cas2